MAQLIRAVAEDHVFMKEVAPANGKTFTLEEMQGFVGGYIEALRLTGNSVMYLNEDGKRLDLPYNLVADMLAHRMTLIAPNDRIVGDVLIASLSETGDDEDEV